VLIVIPGHLHAGCTEVDTRSLIFSVSSTGFFILLGPSRTSAGRYRSLECAAIPVFVPSCECATLYIRFKYREGADWVRCEFTRNSSAPLLFFQRMPSASIRSLISVIGLLLLSFGGVWAFDNSRHVGHPGSMCRLVVYA